MKLVLSCLLLLVHFQAAAKIKGPKRYDFKGVAAYVSGDLFMAKESFDSDGGAYTLQGSGEYWLADIPFGFRHIHGGNLGFEAELKASYAQSKSTDTLNGTTTRTNSQIHELRVSTDFLYETPTFDLIPEFELVHSFAKIRQTRDDVLLGEGVQSLIGRLHLQTEFGQTDFFSNIGYQRRDDGRSSLLPWSLGLGWQTAWAFFGGRVFGFQSISNDTDRDQPFSREAFINVVNAGASRFYGVNPSSIAAEGLMFFKLGRVWELQLNAGLDLAGENYSKGLFAGGTLIFDFGQSEGLIRRRKVIRKSSIQNRRGGLSVDTEVIDFQEETKAQEEDQKYFEPPQPVRPKPREPRARPMQGPTAPSEGQLQKSLDDVEMTIELKKKKRGK